MEGGKEAEIVQSLRNCKDKIENRGLLSEEVEKVQNLKLENLKKKLKIEGNNSWGTDNWIIKGT